MGASEIDDVVSAKHVFAMLENESLWDTAVHCHRLLAAADILHAVLGGVAVCLYGYQRNTVDLDILVRPNDSAAIRTALEGGAFVWDPTTVEFRSQADIPVYLLMTGDRAGSGSEVRLADPNDSTVVREIEGLPVLSLERLIETKLACGLGSLRRTHKDFADVVELIVQRQLSSSFARHLHNAVRPTFRKLVREASAH